VLRKVTGDSEYKTALERLRQTVPFKVAFVDALQRPFLMLVLEPIVLFFSLYMSMVYIVLFGDFVAYGYIFAPFDLNAGQLGLTFIPIAIGVTIVGLATPLVYAAYRKELQKVQDETGKEAASPQPEERLRLAMIGTWFVPISLFWLAWTTYSAVSIWPALVSQVFFGIGILCCFISSYQYIIDAYLSTAASALSTLTLVRYPISGAAVMFTGPMFTSLGTHWALSLLAFLSLVISLIPWAFYFWGPKIRSWSRYTPKVKL